MGAICCLWVYCCYHHHHHHHHQLQLYIAGSYITTLSVPPSPSPPSLSVCLHLTSSCARQPRRRRTLHYWQFKCEVCSRSAAVSLHHLQYWAKIVCACVRACVCARSPAHCVFLQWGEILVGTEIANVCVFYCSGRDPSQFTLFYHNREDHSRCLYWYRHTVEYLHYIVLLGVIGIGICTVGTLRNLYITLHCTVGYIHSNTVHITRQYVVTTCIVRYQSEGILSKLRHTKEF